MTTFYTDGSAHPNPGPGGFGVVELDDNENIIQTYAEYSENTTNNAEELKAILWVMENYGKNNPTVYSDSSYAVNTYTKWGFSWKRNNWIKSDNKIPENLNIIKKYFDLYEQGYRINLICIRGHNGIKGNEIADLLATGKYK